MFILIDILLLIFIIRENVCCKNVSFKSNSKVVNFNESLSRFVIHPFKNRGLCHKVFGFIRKLVNFT